MNLIELSNHYDEEVEIQGFVESIRNIKWVQFLVIRDLSGKVQVTIEKSEEKNASMVELVNNLTVESTVKIKGKLIKNENVKLNGMEIIPSSIIVTSKSEEELPFNYKDLDNVNLDTRLDYRFIDLRNEKNNLIFRAQSELVKYMREYLYNNNFTEIHTPKLISCTSV